MSNTKMKLCGLSTEEDILTANEIMPDYIGFVFADFSRRYVSPDRAAQLKALLKDGIQAVGVFVDAEPALVAEYLQKGIIDVAQLHGHEDEAYLQTLRAMTDKPIIQAVQLHSTEDFQRALNSTAEYLLLDGGTGDGKGIPPEYLNLEKLQGKTWFLAGGLSPDNVAEQIAINAPYGVDVSSGIEVLLENGKASGRKDPQKMKQFAEQVRNQK